MVQILRKEISREAHVDAVGRCAGHFEGKVCKCSLKDGGVWT